ncbi:hypothetical protein MNBD_GAMMA09-3611, partial [hydrothermal vent metagenome]
KTVFAVFLSGAVIISPRLGVGDIIQDFSGQL